MNDGIDALAARLALIEASEKTLDLQYYIWHDDLVGRALHNRLLTAADRGVRIRLLLDDMDTAGKDDTLAVLNDHPNIEIRVFNAFRHRAHRWMDFVSNLSRMNHRMHNKSIVADRAVGIMGGRNIGDEYFNASQSVGFSDMDVVVAGPVVAEIEQSFSLYWNSPWSYEFDEVHTSAMMPEGAVSEFRRTSDANYREAANSAFGKALAGQWKENFVDTAGADFSWGKWRLFYDSPQKISDSAVGKAHHIAPHLLEIMDQAKRDVVMVSPYFVPGDFFSEYLVNKVKSGVRVRVLTNSLASNDVSLVHAGYRRYREELILGGVELYEYKSTRASGKNLAKKLWSGSSRASLHGKYIGFDERYVFVGSFNLDARSVSINTEMGVLFESDRYGKQLSRDFDRLIMRKAYSVQLDDEGDMVWKTINNDKLVTYHKEPETNVWQRFVTGFLSIFVPESEL